MKYSLGQLPDPVRRDLSHIADILVKETIARPATQDRYTPGDIRHITLRGGLVEDHWTPDSYWFDAAYHHTALSVALSGLEGHCAELHTIADILRSLSDLTAGVASSCEFALMGQILQERTLMIEEAHGKMADLVK